MKIFDFPYHVFERRYPESSKVVSLGRGYEFASRPRGPDQVKMLLHYKTMVFFETVPGFYDIDKHPRLNMAVLERFYNEHKMYEKFIYPHPIEGDIIVRFARPLSYKIAENGHGTVEPFTIELTSQP